MTAQHAEQSRLPFPLPLRGKGSLPFPLPLRGRGQGEWAGTLRLLFATILALLVATPAALAAKTFPVAQFSFFLSDYDEELSRIAKDLKRAEAELIADIAVSEAAGNARLAAASMEQLLTLRPGDGQLWLRLARQLVVAAPLNDSDGYALPSRIIGAGLKAYTMLSSPQEEAESLDLAAQGFVKREMWRPALTAYKESLKLAGNPALRATYEQLRADRGFRVSDYRIDTDVTPPRACFEMSEPLSRTVTDFTSYVTQSPGPVAAVTAEGTRLCVEGLNYGERYAITVRQGLPAAIDDTTAKDATFEFYVRDRSASVRFSGNAYVLPRTGQSGIPLISVNSKEAKLALYRIGDRNLIASVFSSDFRTQISGYSANDIANQNGKRVWQGTLETPSPLNKDATIAIPVDEAIGKLEPGLYVMTAEPAQRQSEDDVNIATQWFVVSDLGLSTMNAKDGLHVAVRSIATAAPVANASIRLLARNNDVLAEASTDPQGNFLIDAGLMKGEGGAAPALLVARSGEGDYSFIDLSQAAFDLTDRGVDGRAAPGPVDAFVYAERGVYRRGETVHATVLLRDDKANAMPGTPLTLVVERPDGVVFLRQSLDDEGAGGYSHSFEIAAGAQGGTWRIKALTDPNAAPVGETSFLVEDYIPDRIEFDLTSKTPRITPAQGLKLTVDGRYLFGAPAAGLDLEANVAITADNTPFPQWKDYSFGLMDERPDSIQVMAEGLPQTDINGRADLDIALPELPVTTRPLKADVAVRLREPGGRAVERTASLPVEASQPMLGIMAGFADGSAPEGQAASFNVIALDPAGTLVPVTGATWTLKRLTRDWQWFNTDGAWRWEAVTRTSKLANGTLDIAVSAPTPFTQTLSWGEYRLEIAAQGMSPVSIDFSAGYYGGESAKSDTPDTLKLALDKTDVTTGDTVNLKIEARYPGKATIRIVGERQLAVREVDVPEGGLTIPFTVEEGWGTGAYVLASLLKPMDVTAKRMPSRAMGVAWFGIDRAARTLDVTLATPEMTKPRNTLTVPVKLGNLAAGEEAFVTIAAVDVGILNLTRYNPPSPDNFYYDQKRLAADLRDIYGQLIDGMQGERGKLRSGGDGGAAFNAPPPAQKPLALYSGIIKVAEDGTASVDFAIPAFNGTIRVMAVAWSGTKLGHASKDVLARDPVVVSGTLPRFLSVGDRSELRFDIVNAEAPAGDYTLGVSIDGPVMADAPARIQKLTLGAAGARASIIVPVKATGLGTASVIATLKGPGDILLDQDYVLGVTPANPAVTRRTTLPLMANGGALTIGKDLLSDMLPGTGSIALSVSPLPQLDAAGLVRDLDRYPYGCSEQTVSRALPLLYLSELGVSEKDIDGELKQRMQEAVTRLADRQSGSGNFGLWSAYDGGSLWLSAYVTDFLLRAREKGFAVPEETLMGGLDYIRNMVGNAPDIEEGQGQDMAYALYVLARAGRAPVGDLKYLADTKLKGFGSPLARAQLASALSMLGDTARADTAFAAAIEALASEVESAQRGQYRSDYGSVLRDSAAILALATEAKARPDVIRTAMSAVAVERARTSYASTQDMAWMVLAARAVAGDAKAIRLDVAGSPHEGSFNRIYREEALAQDVRVANSGPEQVRATIAISGVPFVPEPASANGLIVERKYFTADGQEADMTRVKQNTRLVVVLSVMKAEGNSETGNYLLVDRLPAGLEVENPVLVASGSTANIPWLTDTTWPSYTEFRDDRFVAAFNDSTGKFAYMVRAVAPGQYSHPGAFVEDMYRPQINARSAYGTMTVERP
jgi:alpha-2-macroglobulin